MNDLSPLDSVKWFQEDLIASSRFHSVVGHWSRPDTIVLDVTSVEDTITVMHELLHYVLQDGEHPVYYFVTKCHLLPMPINVLWGATRPDTTVWKREIP